MTPVLSYFFYEADNIRSLPRNYRFYAKIFCPPEGISFQSSFISLNSQMGLPFIITTYLPYKEALSVYMYTYAKPTYPSIVWTNMLLGHSSGRPHIQYVS